MRADRTPERWLDTVALAGLVYALVFALRQRAFHGLDAQYVIGMVRDHANTNYSHPLYLPLMNVWHALLAPAGLSPFESLRLASGLGVALGALAMHRASLALGLGRAPSLMATALACSAPAVLFFATVVELHGVFFALAGLAFWQWARTVTATSDTKRAANFALLGLCTALASGMHSSGHFLLWLLLALTWGLGVRGGWRRPALTLAAHALTTLVIYYSTSDAAVAATRTWREVFDEALAYWGPRVPWAPHEIAALWWREWLYPFLPLSIATCAALAVRAQRRRALAILVGIVPLLGLVWILLHRELRERGAYLLPFSWPAAVLVVGWWRGWLQGVALALALTLAIGQIWTHDRVEEDIAWRRTLRPTLDGSRALLICFDMREVDQALRDLPTVTPRPIDWLAGAVLGGYDPLCAEFDAWVAPYLDAGASVWITPRAMEILDVMNQPAVRRFKAEHLAQRYRLEPLDDADFRAVRVWRQ